MTRGKGECFGEMAILDDSPRSASVTALTDAHLLKLSRVAFEEILLQEPSIYQGLFSTLTKKIRQDIDIQIDTFRKDAAIEQDLYVKYRASR